jgi:hypothetical protein
LKSSGWSRRRLCRCGGRWKRSALRAPPSISLVSAAADLRKVIDKVLLAIAPTRGQSSLTPQRRGPLGQPDGVDFSAVIVISATCDLANLGIDRAIGAGPRAAAFPGHDGTCRVITRTPAREIGNPSSARASIRETRIVRPGLFVFAPHKKSAAADAERRPTRGTTTRPRNQLPRLPARGRWIIGRWNRVLGSELAKRIAGTGAARA